MKLSYENINKVKSNLNYPSQLFIDGKYQKSITEKSFENISPIDGKIINNVYFAQQEDTDIAVSCLKSGLEILVQDSAMFHNRISYHNWEGMSTSTEECEIIFKNLGKNNTMILRNHGLLTAGKTIGEAFMLMYYLDRACKVQIDLLNSNKEIIKPSDNLLEFAAGQYNDPKYKLGEHEWPALKRMLEKNNSIYEQ